jgi:hypothetical protein
LKRQNQPILHLAQSGHQADIELGELAAGIPPLMRYRQR